MPLVNDVHSRLNPTEVDKIVRPQSIAELVALIKSAGAAGQKISISGSRHAMGGQQFAAGQILLDMRELNRVLAFDTERGLITVEAGCDWVTLYDRYSDLQTDNATGLPPWGFRQKQTGADRLTLGGAAAVNAHGRGLSFKPLISDIEDQAANQGNRREVLIEWTKSA